MHYSMEYMLSLMLEVGLSLYLYFLTNMLKTFISMIKILQYMRSGIVYFMSLRLFVN